MTGSPLPLSLPELLASPLCDKSNRFLFFWGHRTPSGQRGVGKECLSQFYPAPFTVEGRVFPTAEHWMMASKAKLFGDVAAFEQVLEAKAPAQAKAVGRTVNGFDETRWLEHRMGIVFAGNSAKFGQNAELREYLLGTEGKILIEASPSDRIWGIGLAADSPHATNPRLWRGMNLLGFALMQVRAGLAAG